MQDSGRGKNPSSHRNKPKIAKEAKLGTVYLTPSQWKLVEGLGEGNKSKGVRISLDLLFKAKTALQCMLSKLPQGEQLAEEVLSEFEELEVKHAYEEFENELPKPKGGVIII